MKIFFNKCQKCGNIIWSFDRKNIKCCNQEMKLLNPNSIDASFEKHVPTYEIIDDKIKVKVNHVMEDKHYIMWIMIVSEDNIEYKEFKPGDIPETTFNYYKSAIIYSYCNLHELWSINL